MMTLGAGAAMSMSKAHKINTKSSTESELAVMDDALPDIVWDQCHFRSPIPCRTPSYPYPGQQGDHPPCQEWYHV